MRASMSSAYFPVFLKFMEASALTSQISLVDEDGKKVSIDPATLTVEQQRVTEHLQKRAFAVDKDNYAEVAFYELEFKGEE